MLAGIAAYIKAVNPEVKVIGVEADDAAGHRPQSRLPLCSVLCCSNCSFSPAMYFPSIAQV